VKQLLLRALERMGYVLIHAPAWRELQNQLTACGSERGELQNQLTACRSERGELQNQRGELQDQLTACRSERHTLALRIDRSEAKVHALMRDRDRLQTELTACRGQLARADTTGRIHDLENDTQRLRQRIADLEVFLQETQKMRT